MMNRIFGALIFPLALSSLLLGSPTAQVGEVRIVGPSQSFLGVLIQDVTAEEVTRLGLPREQGVYVNEVTPNSPAARAGVREGDVIYEYSGIPVISVAQFRRLVSETPVGRELELQVWRDGEPMTLHATVEARGSRRPGGGTGNSFSFRVPKAPPDLGDLESQGIFIHRRGPLLGIQGVPLTDQMAEFLGIPGKQGVLVLEVGKDTPGAAAGLKAGDVILSVNGTPVENPAELAAALAVGPVELQVARGGQMLKLQATLETSADSDATRM